MKEFMDLAAVSTIARYLIFIAVPIIIIGGGTLIRSRSSKGQSGDSTRDKNK